MRAALIVSISVLTACSAAHVTGREDGGFDAGASALESGVDAGADPRAPCDRPRGCRFDCCQDPDTGYRYCCDYNYTYTDEDGVDVYLCGDEPACPHSSSPTRGSHCCSDMRALFRISDIPYCTSLTGCDSYADLAIGRVFPPGELPDGSDEEWGPRLTCTSAADCFYDCCTDPDTGERFCCDYDRVTRADDGSTMPLCGAGPPCPNNAHCCAEQSARFPPPQGIRRCTYNVFMCEWLAEIP